MAEKGLHKRVSSRAAPHKWLELSKRFSRIGIRLATCKSYAGANECRILNNKIKHVGTVDGELSKFGRYSEVAGMPIDKIEIDVQYYANAAYEFIGCVMEVSGDVLGRESGP
jgi:hypothetical protein